MIDKTAYYKSLRAEKRLRGECIYCANPVVPGFSKCDRHLAIKKLRDAQRHKRLKRAGLCKCGAPVNPGAGRATICDRCSEMGRVSKATKRQVLKRQVIDLLGGKCACCGETELVWLTVDHINGDGKQHRAGHPSLVYQDIIDHPDRFALRILCWNCNAAYALLGLCPHQV